MIGNWNDFFNMEETLKRGLKYEDVLILETLYCGIEKNIFQTTQGKNDKKYYIVNGPYLKALIGDNIKCLPDNILRRVKNLAKAGYLDLVSGTFAPEYGFSKMAFRLDKEFKKILISKES